MISSDVIKEDSGKGRIFRAESKAMEKNGQWAYVAIFLGGRAET